MKRRFAMFRNANAVLAGSAMIVLAGCGDSADFTVEIDGSSDAVKRELRQISPNALTGTAGIAPVRTEWIDADTLRFELPGKDGRKGGELVFTVAEAKGANTEIAVRLDIPVVTRRKGGKREILVESKMEDMLEEVMEDWSGEFGASGSTASARSGISGVISIFAIGIQKFDDFETAATGALASTYIRALSGPEGGSGWGDRSGSSDWGSSGADADAGWSGDSETGYGGSEDRAGGWGDAAD